MQNTKVRDRNGRKTKIGDRVRISAEEMNKSLIADFGYEFIYDNDLLCLEDGFGTVTFQYGFLQIVDEYGDMIIDLSHWKGKQCVLFEVVTLEA